MDRARAGLPIPRQPGFSLVELIVVIVVLGIVAGMGAIVVRDGMLGYLRGREITSADWQGRLAFERITRELRDVAAPNYSNIAVTSCGTATFTFSDTSSTLISYSQSDHAAAQTASRWPIARTACVSTACRAMSSLPSYRRTCTSSPFP
jgi:prepilin-type N-terminal cleavage/methylation domain-containing protein